MNFFIIGKLLGRFFKGFSLILLPCLMLACYDESLAAASYPTTLGFFFSALICWIVGVSLTWAFRDKPVDFFRKEAVALVVLFWLSACFVGTLPYLLSGTLRSPIDALFESVSGFTTTGSTIIESRQMDADGYYELPHAVMVPDGKEGHALAYYGTVDSRTDRQGMKHVGIEALPRSILLWRSLSQWLGGGGIVVLFVTLLPLAGIGGKVLFQSEVSGPSKEGLTPRIKETSKILWSIYLTLSALQWLWMMMTLNDMHWFDALTITLSTISTGGFSCYNASIGHFHYPALEWIIIFFMLAGSINFYLFFHLWRRRFYKLADIEFLLFCGFILLGSLICSLQIFGTQVQTLDGQIEFMGFADAVRTGTFQFVSLMSSTGFATVNFDLWPTSSHAIVLLAMFIGGMSGSTSGGLKVIRPYIVLRYIFYRLRGLIQPERIEVFRLHGSEMMPSSLTMVLIFFCVAILSLVAGSFSFIVGGLDLETSFSLSNCFLSNTGQAFSLGGPTHSCAFLSLPMKLGACFLMLLGRLEYVTLFLVMMPDFWKKS